MTALATTARGEKRDKPRRTFSAPGRLHGPRVSSHDTALFDAGVGFSR